MSTRTRLGFDFNTCYFVTTTFREWMHLFLDESYFHVAAESLNHCCTKYKSDVIGYVFMPSHIHLILFFNESPACSDFMRDFKKFTSGTFRTMIDKSGNHDVLERLRYEHDKQLFKVWMTRFDAIVIQHKLVLETKMKYIHTNPVESGLVEFEEDYKWSSARWYKEEKIESVVRLRHAWTII